MEYRELDKQAIKQNAYKTLCKISISGTDYVFTEDDYIVSCTYEDYRYVPSTGFIGQFVERILDGSFSNLPSNVVLENSDINFQVGIINGIDDQTTWYDYGNFLVTSVDTTDTTGVVKFESSDYTKKFNTPYVSDVPYPCLALDVANSVCKQVGVALAGDGKAFTYAVGESGLVAGTYDFIDVDEDTGAQTIYEFTTTKDLKYQDSLMLIFKDNKLIQRSVDDSYNVTRDEISYSIVTSATGTSIAFGDDTYVDFVNNDFVIIDNQADSDTTCRDIMKHIAKLGYTWVRVGQDNKVYLDFSVKHEEDVDSYNELTTDEYYSSTKQDVEYGPVNKVLIGMSSVEGENIYAEQDKDKIVGTVIHGKCGQEVRSGKNLLKISNPTCYAYSNAIPTTESTGITINSYSDNAISITSSTSAFRVALTDVIQLEPKTTYTISFDNEGSSTSDARVYVYLMINDSYNSYARINGYGHKTHTFTTYTGGKIRIGFGYGANSSGSTSSYTNIMIEKGSTATDYEAYGISPSPDDPSPITPLTGITNLFNVNNFEVYQTSTNTTYKVEDDKLIVTTTDGNAWANIAVKLNLTDGYKTFHFDKITHSNSNMEFKRMTLSYYISGTRTSVRHINVGETEYVKIENADDKQYVLEFWTTGATGLTNESVFENIMIEEGTTPHTYVPYGTYIKETNHKKNLYNYKLGNVSSTWQSATTYDNDTGTLSMTATGTSGVCYARISNQMPLEIGKTYTLSFDASDNYRSVRIYNPLANSYTTELTDKTYTFTATEENVQLVFYVTLSTSCTISNIQVEEGSSKTDYEVYEENYTLIDLSSNELWSVGDVSDTYSTIDHVFTKGIGKIILDPTAYTWTALSTTSYFANTSLGTFDQSKNWLISDYFTSTARDDIDDTKDYITISSDGNIRINKTDLTSLDDLKTWLTSNTVTVYYILNEPILSTLNESGKIESFKGYNFISLNTIPTTIDVKVNDLNQDIVTYSGYPIELDCSDYTTCELQIMDNIFTYTEALRRIAIHGCERLFGLRYTPLDINSIGHPWLEGDDYIKLTNVDNEVLYSYPFDRKIDYKGYIVSELSSEAQSITETTYENSSEVLDRLKHTELIVNKSDQQISTAISTATEAKSLATTAQQTANGFSTRIETIENANLTTRVSTLEDTVDGISKATTVTGGTNLIKNSVGYFGTDYWSIDESTPATVKNNTDTDVQTSSLSGSALSLQNETMYQTLSPIKNGTYYISFSYKLEVEAALCYAYINDTKFDLTNTRWTDIAQTIAVTNSSITIKFVSDVADACLITDLMLTEGNSKTSWSMNSNETYTDTVKIGKGITISATGSDTSLEAITSGINIKNSKSGEVTSTFNKYGSETNQLTVHNKAIIEDTLLINKVGGQIWISTIE